jgi:hypothetical protein
MIKFKILLLYLFSLMGTRFFVNRYAVLSVLPIIRTNSASVHNIKHLVAVLNTKVRAVVTQHLNSPIML